MNMAGQFGGGDKRKKAGMEGTEFSRASNTSPRAD